MQHNDNDKCIEISDLSFSYGKESGLFKNKKQKQTQATVLNEISLAISRNKVTTLIGGNGCGKSTLFHLITKNLKSDQGSISIDGRQVDSYGHKEFARKVAIVHQNNTASADITVEGLVGYGRNPYLSICNPMTEKDHQIVEWAMEVTSILELRDRTVMSLSGGQRQRVWIAMALAQKTEILLLDEPTTYLDIRYQIELLEMIRHINREYGITIVMVLHDMNHAIYYSDEVIGMRDGRIIVSGEAGDVITDETIKQIYGIDLDVMQLNDGKFVVPVRRNADVG